MAQKEINLSRLILKDVEKVRAEACFTTDQLRVFELLRRDNFYDSGIMVLLGLDRKTYYKIKDTVYDKVERVLA